MARVFTTPFTFNGQTYHAFVTAKANEGKMDFHIHLQDIDLHEIIPGGRFDYNTEEGCKQAQLLESKLARMIVDCVSRSIDEHLRKAQHIF
jgi:hypothetical protein